MENSSLLLSITSDYTTTKPTASMEDQTLELPLVVILCTVLSVASVVGTLGNTLVLLSIIKFDNLRAIPDLFIFSLSLSDLLVTTVYQPLRAYRLAHLGENSEEMHLLIITSRFLGHFSLIASITNMFGVTVERLISIRFPLRYDLLVTRKRAVITVICIWIFSITYGAIWSQGLAPESYLAIYFIAILTGTVLIYAYIFLVAKRLEETVAQVRNGSTEEERPNSRKERKAAKTIVIVVGVAVVCWLPLLVVAHALANDPDRARFLKVVSAFQVWSVCNSSINPYIYCARSQRYYVAFVKLLGLRRVLPKKVQVAVAPKYSPRDATSSARDTFQEMQLSKGEMYDVAL